MTAPSIPMRWPLAEAEAIAEAVVEHLAPFCLRIEVAGSIRRRRPDVADVGILVYPNQRQQVVPLFEDLEVPPDVPPVDMLDEHLADMLEHREVLKRRDKSRAFWGPSDKRMLWRYGAASTDWIPVDVFGATPETWGAKLALRTGPWEFSRRLVTHRGGGRDGVLSGDLVFRDGGLYRYSADARRHFVPTPDEETLFRELGLPYVAPEHRHASTHRHYWSRRPHSTRCARSGQEP